MINLRFQMVCVVIAPPSGQNRAYNTAGSADQRRRNDGSENRSAGNNDCAHSNSCARIGEAAHYATLSIPSLGQTYAVRGTTESSAIAPVFA